MIKKRFLCWIWYSFWKNRNIVWLSKSQNYTIFFVVVCEIKSCLLLNSQCLLYIQTFFGSLKFSLHSFCLSRIYLKILNYTRHTLSWDFALFSTFRSLLTKKFQMVIIFLPLMRFKNGIFFSFILLMQLFLRQNSF